MKVANTLATIAALAALTVANHAKAASPSGPMTPIPGIEAQTNLFQTASVSPFGRYCKNVSQYQQRSNTCQKRGQRNLWRCRNRSYQSKSACEAFYRKFVPQCLKAACGIR